MYLLKIILRALTRHKKRGRKLILLVGFCVAAIIFSLTMGDSFYSRYVNLFVGTATGHIAVVSEQAAEFKRKPWKRGAEGLHLIHIDAETCAFIDALPHLVSWAPMIRSPAQLYTFDGEPQGGTTLVGIDPARLFKVFPSLKVIEGVAHFNRDHDGGDVPLLRRNTQFWEVTPKTPDAFKLLDFRVEGEKLEQFKAQFSRDFDRYIPVGTSLKGEKGTPKLLMALNAAISDKAFLECLPTHLFADKNIGVLASIEDFRALPLRASVSERKVARKRVLGQIYPDVFQPVVDCVRLNTRMTAQTMPARNITTHTMPIVIPVTFCGIVQVMPLYGMESYLDVRTLRQHLEIGSDEYTDVVLRLDSLSAVPKVQAILKKYFQEQGQSYAVLDYREMGSGYMPTAVGFKIGLEILVGLFVMAIVIFIVNMIMLAVIKRRREIGTAVVLGMSRGEYVLVFLGEVFVLVTVAWLFGAALGAAVVAFLARFGMPGIPFFIGGILYFDFSWRNFWLSYGMVLPIALLAALLPTLSILKLKPVDVFRETR